MLTVDADKFFEKERILYLLPESKEKLKDVNTIIFDMDGVVTSEKNYWITAGLTALEIFYSRDYLNQGAKDFFTENGLDALLEQSGQLVTSNFISLVKTLSINTNWDLAYFSISLFILEFLKNIEKRELINWISKQGLTPETIRYLGLNVKTDQPKSYHIDRLGDIFFKNYPHLKGLQYIDCLNAELKKKTKINCELFSRNGQFWILCQEIFQEWFLGTETFEAQYRKRLSYFFKDGLIKSEAPVISITAIKNMLRQLNEKQFLSGIATGRPFDEIMPSLKSWEIDQYFDKERVATHTDVEEAEKLPGIERALSKPDPYLFLKALYPDESPFELINKELPLTNSRDLMVVTDSVSDVVIAKKLGCLCVAVLTGVTSEIAKEGLYNSKPDFILNDVSLLPELLFG